MGCGRTLAPRNVGWYRYVAPSTLECSVGASVAQAVGVSQPANAPSFVIGQARAELRIQLIWMLQYGE